MSCRIEAGTLLCPVRPTARFPRTTGAPRPGPAMNEEAIAKQDRRHRGWRRWARAVSAVVMALAGLWAFGAVIYDGPWPDGGNRWLAIGWLASFLWLWLRPPRRPRVLALCGRRGAALAAWLLVLLPWLAIRPSNERDWQPEFARTGHAEIGADGRVTLHEVRNFDWQPDGSAVERWVTRSYHLERLRGVDLVFDAFMGDLLAHPMLSFDFGQDGRVVLSVETRREVGQSFSALGGLYKMFELQYLYGDESDFIRLRTNVRDQPVYLHRLRGDLGMWRQFFLTTVEEMNRLHERPRFYNVITQNCTTSLFALLPASDRGRWDWRVLVNGRLDELLWSRGVFDTGDGAEVDTLEELRQRAIVNQRAREVRADEDFSSRLREGRSEFGG